MQTVSNAYKVDINKTVRNFSFIKLLLNMSDPDIVDTNTTTDNGHVYFSTSETTDAGFTVNNPYATMEHNRMILDGKQTFPPEVGSHNISYQGFVGSEISNANGLFITNPKITTVFAEYTHFAGISFKFDDLLDCYPTEMDIIAYDNSTVIETLNCHPTSSSYTTPLGVPSSDGQLCNKIEVVFKSMSMPNRRLRLSYIVFGLMKEWTDETITEATWARSTDLLSAKLPIHSFEFTCFDPTMEYNPDNPTGLWQYVEQLQPLTITYGYELDDGNIEWINGGHLFTTGKIDSDSAGSLSKVKFYTESILNQLTDTYYKGVYSASPVSLYTLATNVFIFANLRNLSSGLPPYYIDPALQSIYTSCPIPELPINEALQLIANAGRCVLYVDRDGRINIERIAETLTDFSLNFSNMVSIPEINKTPTLRSVNTSFVTLNVLASSSLVKATLNYATATLCKLSYDEAVAASYTVTGTLTVVGSPLYYATCCMVTVVGSGTIEITGTKLSRATNGVSYSASNAGYDCPIENSLLNNYTDALAYATWVATILSRKNLYSVKDRGYPELDTLDCVSAQTLFSSAIEATITDIKLEYNGTISSETSFLAK